MNEKDVLEARLEAILSHIGWLGKFTLRSNIIMFIICVFGAMNIGSTVFLAAKMDHTCIPSEDLTSNITEKCGVNWTDLQTSLISPTKDNKTLSCEMYTLSSLLENTSCTYWTSGVNDTNRSLTTETCTSWEYDQSMYESTIVSDFNLVCGNAWKTSMSQFLLMVGVFLGAMICGIGSDRFGRKTFFAISIVVIIVSAGVSSLSVNYWMYALVHMFVGFGGIGLCVSGYVYVMEITSDKHRVFVGQTLQMTFSLGFVLLSLCGYLQRNWVYLNLAVSLPLIVLLPFYLWFSKESPRWLLSKNQTIRAKRILQIMAKANGKEIDEYFEKPNVHETPLVKPDEPIIIDSSQKNSLSTLEMFRNPTLRKISLILFYNWFVVTCIYYGLTLNATALIGNPYLNFFLSGFIEFPAYLGSSWVIHIWGRRPTIFTCNMISGISLLCMNLLPDDLSILRTVLFLIGKFGSSATFGCVYLYSSELYPTPLRGNGVGICSSCARLGGMASQLIFMLSQINNNLPYIVFGGISALAGMLVIILPETKGSKLPETIEDTEKLYKHRNVTLVKQFVPRPLRKCV
uniref:Organic cation transporter protein-like n=1 Tax=Phallusia mammillata TaxID=59560 RepID=A0A6F9DRT3_9ASCI|nr:organic cation transporter protein-like [Phallusia mammillata]